MLLALGVLLSATPASAATGDIETIAGNGSFGYSGDGGPATSAALRNPYGVALDNAGNLYIADTFNNRIRRVDATTGIITTVAGTGVAGYAGDGGPAINARLNAPVDVALDAGGNLYIADYVNHRIRRVDASTGIITTVAGTGVAGYSGDGGLANSAWLSYPSGMAFDAGGNLYIADLNNNRVRRVAGGTGIITTVAGNGTAGYSGDGGPATNAWLFGPAGVALDAGGNLYIADLANHRIRRVDGGTGIITTVAGDGTGSYGGDGGPATSAQLNAPYSVALDAGGNLYLADSNNHRIRRVDGGTGIITTVAGDGTGSYGGDGGPAINAQLNTPRSVTLDSFGNLVIGDTGNYRIRRVEKIGVSIITPGTNGGNGPGGVGVTDGSSTLELWLRADKGVFSDPGCTSAATDGGTVGCWQDQSGNGLHVTRATEAQRPGYLEQNGNNQPALTFSGSQFLERAYNAGFHPTNFTLYAANSVTGGTSYRTPVGNRNFTSCGYNLYATPGNTWEYWPNGGGGWATIGNAPVGLNQWTFQTATYDSINRNAFYKDGSLNATSLFAYVSCATQGSTPDFVIGNIAVNGAYGFIGNQSEVVLFGEELPPVRRILVDNYLSAKYDIALSANDVYDGDFDDADHNFDLDVAGIGQFGGNQHTQAFGAGMIVVDNSFLNDDGDWLLFGHNTAVNAKSSDVPTTGDWASATNPMRWARNWYIDVTDANSDGGTVDIVFDFSEAGMNGGQPPSGPVSNYRLLKRADPSSPFTDIATATAVVGDQVHFQNVDVSLLGSNFTLGTLDDGASPTAVTLTTFSSTGQATGFIVLVFGTLFLMSLALLAWRRAERAH